jgi:hypothetical protein
VGITCISNAAATATTTTTTTTATTWEWEWEWWCGEQLYQKFAYINTRSHCHSLDSLIFRVCLPIVKCF